MIQNDNLQSSGIFYGTFLDDQSQSTDNKNPIFSDNIETILPIDETPYHYLCTKCKKFPFIEFKDKKNIIKTCSCINNQKISITTFLDNIESNKIEESFLSSSTDVIKNNNNLEEINAINQKNIFDFNDRRIPTIEADYITKNKDILNPKNGFMCIKHNKKFKYFCKSCLRNLCDECKEYEENKDICGYNFLVFEEFDIYNKKIDQLISIINKSIDINKNSLNNFNLISNESDDLKLLKKNDTYLDQLSVEEEEKDFNKLIKIIIDDYKNYPNYSHFFNIENTLRFLNIKDKLEFKENKDNKDNNDNNESNQNNEIIIEYINNINNKTKLFSKKFVENNKEKLNLEIDGEILELKEEHIFKSTQKVITIKLFLKKEEYEIDLFKMFANCKNLISFNGLSKWKKTKIINISKMFYNCTSLSSIPDINEWDISKVIDFYLIFYNCISLIFFPNIEINLNNLYKKNVKYLGLLITKYFNINNEIIIKNVIENNSHDIYLFGNKYNINNENILIINGKKNELIACYKNENIKYNNEIVVFYKNLKENNGKEIDIKIRLINKINMSNIIKYCVLNLSKWNTNNISDMSYMFYNCSSLSSLPDLSKWNTNNVTNMSNMFYNCSSLLSLPDLSKWNTNNIKYVKNMFYNCSSLSSSPDLSKWNINNVIDMSWMFYNCSSLSSLPDLSKWNTNNVIDMGNMFYNCSSLLSLPDLSIWNTNNVKYMINTFSKCSSLLSLPFNIYK